MVLGHGQQRKRTKKQEEPDVAVHPVFSALGKRRQKGHESKVDISYIMTSRLAWGT